jgi:hypothetical protein
LFSSEDHTYNSLAISLLAGGDGPIELGAAAQKPGNPRGFTFLGQFIDHDLTEFRVVGEDFRLIPTNPTIGQRQRVLEDRQPTATNGRIGSLDLDSVYGLLGRAQPDLYSNNGLFLLQTNERDILRQARFRNGRLIADPRNDENKIVVQIHLLFQRLHNKLHRVKPGTPVQKGAGGSVFNQTRHDVQKAFRRIVLHDYLPRIVQRTHIDAVLAALATGDTFYQAMNKRAAAAYVELFPDAGADGPLGIIAMPVEFAHAVFRLGHSQLLAGYQLNDDNSFPLFASGKDLRGNQPITPAFAIDWKFFFDGGAVNAPHGSPIDATLAAPVFRLPPPSIGEPPISLAERNIRRGVDFGLPTGQEAASQLTEVYGAIPGAKASDLFPASDFTQRFGEVLELEPSLAWATPLWYYMLREAGLYLDGPELGAVGGLIVAETILGSLSTIDSAEFNLTIEMGNPVPTGPPASVDGIYSMEQLLQFLGEF